MNILLLEPDEEIRERTIFAIESSYEAQVIGVSEVAQAMVVISEPGHGVELMVCDTQGGALADFESLQNASAQIPCIFCVEAKAMNQPTLGWNVLSVVDRASLILNVLATLEKLSSKGVVARNSMSDDDFVKIKTSLLLSVCPLKGDIFIRLSESKYVKLFKEGDHFEASDKEKYTARKGIDYLYLRKANTQEFIQKYNADLQKTLAKAHKMNIEEVAKVNNTIHETVQELGKRVGFTRDVQVLARTQVRMTMKSMGKSPSLSQILDRLKAFEGRYIASHSTMVAYMACAVASQMEWGSEGTFHKLTLAAFLHDVTLENHRLAQCNTLAEAEAGGFSKEELADFRVHTVKAAEIANTFQEVPADVDVIIAQHHERPDGTGFPRRLNATYIAPLAVVFIVAHDLAQFAIAKGPGFKVGEFLLTARDRFKSTQFRKVLDSLENLA